MKICITCRTVNVTGGISKYVYELCKYMCSHNHEVHLFTNDFAAPKIDNLIIRHVPMIRVKLFSQLSLFSLSVMFEVWSFFIMTLFMINKKKYDIVHTQGAALFQPDIRTAHSCHLAWITMARKNERNILKKIFKSRFNPLHFLVCLIEKKNYTKANYKKIIAVSKQTKEEVRRYYKVSESDVINIPNGVDVDLFNSQQKEKFRTSLRSKYNFKEDDIVLVFAGHEFKRKGLDIAIDALFELQNENIYLFVFGRDDVKSYANRIKNTFLENRIIFAGETNELNKFFAASDIFVFPTEYEPFGLVAVEAMSSGLPIIVSSCAGVAELIQDGENGYLLDLNDRKYDLIRYLQILMTDKEKIIDMGRKARTTSLNYSWDKIMQQTEKVYYEVVNLKKEKL
ncbi:glycosyltransferase family 4 protein [bacterium]